MEMKKYILVLLVVVAVIVIGYFVSQGQESGMGESMTEKLCEEQGGAWSEMEILREEGHDLFYQCECPDNGPWIREGTVESCK